MRINGVSPKNAFLFFFLNLKIQGTNGAHLSLDSSSLDPANRVTALTQATALYPTLLALGPISTPKRVYTHTHRPICIDDGLI